MRTLGTLPARARATTIPAAAFSTGPVVAECINARHPTFKGRVAVSWSSGDGTVRERWFPTLQGLTVRVADRLLILQPDGWPEPVVIGVLDGYAARPAPGRTGGPVLRLSRDEALHVTDSEGAPLVDVFASERGPVVRLLRADVDVELAGDLRVSARAIDLVAKEGEMRLSAHDDVVVVGEAIHLNP